MGSRGSCEERSGKIAKAKIGSRGSCEERSGENRKAEKGRGRKIVSCSQ